MRFGIFFSYWEDDWKGDYFKYVKKARELGYDALEVSAGELLVMSKDKLRELRAVSKDLDIQISANLGPPRKYDVSSRDPEVRKAGLAFYSDLMDAMGVLGCRKLIGALNSSWPPDFSDLDKPGFWARGVESLKVMGAKAETLGIDLCLEVLNRFDGLILNTAEEGVRFCEEVGRDNVKVHLDTFHMNIEEDDIPTAIRLAGKHLGHMHVCESNRKLPHAGKGALDWVEIGKALHDINYNEFIITESFVRTGCQVGNDTHIWRDLSGGADEAKLDRDAAESVKFLRAAFGE